MAKSLVSSFTSSSSSELLFLLLSFLLRLLPSSSSIVFLSKQICRYPIVFSEDLKKDEPYGIRILGDPLVLFRDKKGAPTCLADRCPHRSAPLSLGTVRQGNIEWYLISSHHPLSLSPSLSFPSPHAVSSRAYNHPYLKYSLLLSLFITLSPDHHISSRLFSSLFFCSLVVSIMAGNSVQEGSALAFLLFLKTNQLESRFVLSTIQSWRDTT
jgi:hypothetical protein